MARTQWIAVDFDHTIVDNHANDGRGWPMEGVREAFDELHSRGYKIMVHSCNNPEYIRTFCETHAISIDGVWGENKLDSWMGKPVAAAYIDDRGVPFRTWEQALADTLALVEGRPVHR